MILRNLFKDVRIRVLVNSAVSVLSLLCLILSGFMGWKAYQERSVAVRLSRMNKMEDSIILAAAQEAMERGVTAAAISGNGEVSDAIKGRISTYRSKGDEALSAALAIAKEVAEEGPGSRFASSYEKTALSLKSLNEARQWVDKSLQGDERFIQSAEWFKTVTAVIDTAARLRQVAFAANKPLEQITQDNLVLKQAVWLISENMGRERGTIGGIIASGEPIPADIAEKLKSFHAVAVLGVSDIMTLKGAQGVDNRVLEAIGGMERALEDFNEVRGQVYAGGASGSYPVSSQDWFERSTMTIDKVLGVSKAVTEVSGEKAGEITRQSFRGVVFALVQIVVTVLFMVFVLFLVYEKMGRIERLRDSMTQLSQGEGDLTFRLDAGSGDEIGKTAAAFNGFMDQLHTIVLQIKKATEQSASAAVELSAAAEQMAMGSTAQSQQAVQAATAIEEMSASVTDVANNVSKIARFSKGANETADKGGHVVEETVHGMQKIAQSVKDAARVIEMLGTSSEQIGEIVSVIDNIAEQTNLLALNAAIEAARANEQGRGFAVVADEVRKLAERTTKATAEIASTIKTIQSDIQKAVRTMDEGTSEVENGVALANEAGDALRQVVDGAQKVSDMIMQIATAAEQQSSVSSEISGNVEKISHLSQENSAAASQTAHAADDLLNLATNLQQMVCRFKV